MSRLYRLAGVLALALVCLPIATAGAATFTVSSNADSGPGSLRAAITASNDPTVTDTITITATGTIDLLTPLPIVSDDVTIAGPGAGALEVRREIGTPLRILHFGNVNATVRDLSIGNGLETAAGGILNVGGNLTLIRVVVAYNKATVEGGSVAEAGGGGIFSSGTLTLRESSVHDNRATAVDASGEVIAGGGGIEASGPVTIERSTISDNTALAIGGSVSDEAFANGGGLLATGGPVTISQSTISGNTAYSSGASSVNAAQGGGVYGGGITLTGSTVARNSADTAHPFGSPAIEIAFGGNLQFPTAGLLSNTIVAEPREGAPSCGGSVDSAGFNLDEGGSCGLDQGTDLSGVVAELEPLAANGGFAPTHALAADSPAVDRGSSFELTSDQRGLPRPSDFASISNAEGGDGSDIGAFELQVLAVLPGGSGSPVVVTQRATDRSPPQTRIISGPPRVTYKTKAEFRFASSEAQSHFQCKLDRKKKWKACTNPFKSSVKPGKHLFRVRAIDRFGNADPTPARFGWRVKRITG